MQNRTVHPTKIDAGEPFSLKIFFDAEEGFFTILIENDFGPIEFPLGTEEEQEVGKTELEGDMDVTFTGYAEEGKG